MSPAWILAALLAKPGDTPSFAAPAPAALDRGHAGEIAVGGYWMRRAAGGGYETETPSFVARVAADGSVTFGDREKLPGQVVVPVLAVANALRGRGGVRAAAKSTAGSSSLAFSEEDLRHDTHHAQKMSFLEATAAWREQLRQANDAAALGAFRKRAEAIAGDRKQPPAQRRQTLFELWQECDESARGAPARAVIEQVIRERFPAGSPTAYTDAELARLRKEAPAAKMRFDPYAAGR